MDVTTATIIVGMISGACSIIAVVISTASANKQIEHKLLTAQAVTDTKIDNLTKQIEQYHMKDIPVMKEQINVLDKRVAKLENTQADIK